MLPKASVHVVQDRVLMCELNRKCKKRKLTFRPGGKNRDNVILQKSVSFRRRCIEPVANVSHKLLHGHSVAMNLCGPVRHVQLLPGLSYLHMTER